MNGVAVQRHTNTETPTLTRTDCWAYAIVVVAIGAYVTRRLLWLQSLQPGYPAAWLDVSSVVLACAGMLALLPWRGRAKRPHWRAATAGALLGLIFFVSTLGFALVDPTRIDWLLHGDWAQHFVGWHLYRSAPWEWPPGAFNSFWYPVGTAIIYTDSLPLLAMPLKLLSPLLPLRFQYIGFWLMLNCMLQGMFGALLLRCFTRNFVLQLIGAGLFLITPVFISRVGHDTLTTQWLLLAGFWLYFRHGNPERAVWRWLAIATIAALVHPYLSVMILALMVAFYVRVTCAQRLLDKRTAVKYVAAIIGTTLFCWWISGAFTLQPDAGNVGFGVYSANLLTWVNSSYMSRWMPTFAYAGGGQYEGRGYLGIGVLALCAVATILATRRDRNIPLIGLRLWPLLLVVTLMTLFAFSTRVAFGSHVLFDITPKYLPVLGAFRASGRFIWCSTYLITLFAIVAVAYRAGRIATTLLALAFLAQLYELAPLHIREARLRFEAGPIQTKQELHDPYWSVATIGRHHVTLVPPPACGKQAAPYLPFSLLAGDHGMTINSGYLARWDISGTRRYCHELHERLARGNRDADSLYIVNGEKLAGFLATSSTPLDCRKADGYTACLVKEQRDRRQ